MTQERRKTALRRGVYWAVMVLLLTAFSVMLFYVGKGHELILENRPRTLAGESFEPIHSVRISFNDEEPIPVRAGFINTVALTGARHTFSAEVLDESGGVLRTLEESVNLGVAQNFVLNVPALLADHTLWIIDENDIRHDLFLSTEGAPPEAYFEVRINRDRELGFRRTEQPTVSVIGPLHSLRLTYYPQGPEGGEVERVRATFRLGVEIDQRADLMALLDEVTRWVEPWTPDDGE